MFSQVNTSPTTSVRELSNEEVINKHVAEDLQAIKIKATNLKITSTFIQQLLLYLVNQKVLTRDNISDVSKLEENIKAMIQEDNIERNVNRFEEIKGGQPGIVGKILNNLLIILLFVFILKYSTIAIGNSMKPAVPESKITVNFNELLQNIEDYRQNIEEMPGCSVETLGNCYLGYTQKQTEIMRSIEEAQNELVIKLYTTNNDETVPKDKVVEIMEQIYNVEKQKMALRDKMADKNVEIGNQFFELFQEKSNEPELKSKFDEFFLPTEHYFTSDITGPFRNIGFEKQLKSLIYLVGADYQPPDRYTNTDGIFSAVEQTVVLTSTGEQILENTFKALIKTDTGKNLNDKSEKANEFFSANNPATNLLYMTELASSEDPAFTGFLFLKTGMELLRELNPYIQDHYSSMMNLHRVTEAFKQNFNPAIRSAYNFVSNKFFNQPLPEEQRNSLLEQIGVTSSGNIVGVVPPEVNEFKDYGQLTVRGSEIIIAAIHQNQNLSTEQKKQLITKYIEEFSTSWFKGEVHSSQSLTNTAFISKLQALQKSLGILSKVFTPTSNDIAIVSNALKKQGIEIDSDGPIKHLLFGPVQKLLKEKYPKIAGISYGLYNRVHGLIKGVSNVKQSIKKGVANVRKLLNNAAPTQQEAESLVGVGGRKTRRNRTSKNKSKKLKFKKQKKSKKTKSHCK